jgi:hypothetical protein
MTHPLLDCNLSCTFPKGNRTITCSILDIPEKIIRVQYFELDSGTSKEILLDTTPKNGKDFSQ